MIIGQAAPDALEKGVMIMENEKHFCTCTNLTCKLHPSTHSYGCDPCIQKNLKLNELPNCMFKLVNEDISKVRDYSAEGFVDFYNKNKK